MQQRRKLRFNSIDDALADAESLALAEREGRLNCCGNWPLGKALAHLAAWANFANDGYPPEVANPPFPVRLIARLLRNRIINKSMMPGMKIGRLPGGTLALDDCATDEALQRFRSALTRLQQTAPTKPNPVFGDMTHQDWINLNLRHAELHLSFHHPR
jgi:hypothetical protein